MYDSCRVSEAYKVYNQLSASGLGSRLAGLGVTPRVKDLELRCMGLRACMVAGFRI